MIEATKTHGSDLNDSEHWAYVNIHLIDVFPARFVRQAISQALVLSGSPGLANQHPELRQLATGGDPIGLPAGMALFLCLYGGPNARYAGGPNGQAIHRTASGWTHAIEAAYPPFAIQLILRGSTEPAAGIDLSPLTAIAVNEMLSFDMEGLMIGFGNTPFPLDYRPRGMILREEHGEPLHRDDSN